MQNLSRKIALGLASLLLCTGTFAAASAQEAAVPDSENEHSSSNENTIVVMRDRLRRAGGAIGVNPITGSMSCRVTTPSGDAVIDAAACDIALRCAREHRRSRDRAMFTACVEAGYDAFVQNYLHEG